MIRKKILLLQPLLLLIFISCTNDKPSATYRFDTVNNRIWIGEDFWSVPLEDWRVDEGRIECTGNGQQSTCSLLPYVISPDKGEFNISVEMGLLENGINPGSSGLIIGSTAEEDNDHRAAIFFGKGINIGVSTSGYAFIEQTRKNLPSGFDFSRFKMNISGVKSKDSTTISLLISDVGSSVVADIRYSTEKSVAGIIQLVNNFRSGASKNNGPEFWFDNLSVDGDGLAYKPENRYGPVLWTMHTLSRNILKLTVQMPPIADDDSREVEMQFKRGNEWVPAGRKTIESGSRTATFRIENWNSSENTDYRILYPFTALSGEKKTFEYAGVIKRDPVDTPLHLAALTCQFHTGFPYTPVVRNLLQKKPDLIYFSGDQIYETNGGYPIKRDPEDIAILSYLGKWYMFGWAFGEAMRSTPAICTPDDHDVFHGNLWGGGGIARPSGTSDSDDLMGFTQTVGMVNVVNTTQCAHLPDPYNPAPIEQGMSVWYTSMNYGRVSFAIVSDRIFKSGPNLVANWDGRKDHIRQPLSDPSIIDPPGLEMLGKRQEDFLENWIMDWRDADMKVLLSQTPLTNAATHHGQYDDYLLGDMDSGGWPKRARDKALRIIRKGFVFHISGDQHIPSIIQYGIDGYRDAGWGYCTPAIAVGYARWFRPDELGIPVNNRPEHGNANTGEYTDAFGNKNYVYAIGNPGNFTSIKNRYDQQNVKGGGMGYVIFDKDTRNITMESWRFSSDVLNPGPESQHPGWPFTINQMDNYGRKPAGWLPDIKVEGDPDPVIEVTDQRTGELSYIVRIKGNTYSPGIFDIGSRYRISIGHPEKGNLKVFEEIVPALTKGNSEMEVNLD